MGDQSDIFISDEQINSIIEKYKDVKKVSSKQVLFYLLNPSLYPIIIMIAVLSVFFLFGTFKKQSDINSNNSRFGLNLDSLNVTYSQNSLLFNNSILYFTKGVEEYLSNPKDIEKYYKLRSQGFKLLQIDSLSSQQEKALITYINVLDESKATFFKEKANKTISIEVINKYESLLKNKKCVEELVNAEANGLIVSLPCGNSSGLIGNGARMNQLINLKNSYVSQLKLLELDYNLDESLFRQ